jgi:hypothetical protein
VTVDYLDLADYLAIAAEVTGLNADTLLRVTQLGLPTRRYMHRPQASARPSFIPTSSTRPRS